jgi:hypothetical protein
MKICIASRDEAHLISALRKAAYQVGSNAKMLDLSSLEWSERDDESAILYIQHPLGEIISSMRGSIANDAQQIEKQYDIQLQIELEYPCLLIDKSTTDIHYRGMGLTGILRLLLIEASAKSVIQNIVITVNDGVSRIPHLKAMGFQFSKADISHRTKSIYANATDVLFARLHRSTFTKALVLTNKRYRTKLNNMEMAKEVLDKLEELMQPLPNAPFLNSTASSNSMIF